MSVLASRIKFRKVDSNNTFSPQELIDKDKNKWEQIFGIRFLLSKSMEPYRKIKSAVELVNKGDFDFSLAKRIAYKIGPYTLDDSICAELKKKGVALGSGSQLNYTGPANYLQEERFSLLEEKSWEVSEIRNFLAKQEIKLIGWDVDESLMKLVMSQRKHIRWWDALEAYLALEQDKLFELKLWVIPDFLTRNSSLLELKYMIVLHKLNGKEFVLNSDLIKYMEATPDTLITLVNKDDKIMVKESIPEVMNKVIELKRMSHQPPLTETNI